MSHVITPLNEEHLYSVNSLRAQFNKPKLDKDLLKTKAGYAILSQYLPKHCTCIFCNAVRYVQKKKKRGNNG